MAAHRLPAAAMRSNDDIDGAVNSLMLSFDDLRGLPLRQLYHPLFSMIFGSVS